MLPLRLCPRRTPGFARVSDRMIELFADLAWAGMLTTGQLQRLWFPSRRRAQRWLRRCLDLGLLRASLQGEAMHRDSLWALTARGLELLAERGPVSEAMAPARLNPRSQKIRHAVAVRDVAVSFLLGRKRGLFKVNDLRLDTELAAEPAMRAAGIIPDGLADVGGADARRLVLWEVACSTQPLGQVRAKLLAYDRAWRSRLPIFSDDALAVLVFSEDIARADRVRRFVAEARLEVPVRSTQLIETMDPAAVLCGPAIEEGDCGFAPAQTDAF